MHHSPSEKSTYCCTDRQKWTSVTQLRCKRCRSLRFKLVGKASGGRKGENARCHMKLRAIFVVQQSIFRRRADHGADRPIFLLSILSLPILAQPTSYIKASVCSGKKWPGTRTSSNWEGRNIQPALCGFHLWIMYQAAHPFVYLEC